MSAAAPLNDAAWLKHGAVARLLAVLDRDGEAARVVGGAVRNAPLQLPVGEIDVATSAVPQEVIRRVKAAGWKAVPTGIAHGTVTVVIDKHPFEVTTLRQDVETFGRKARVEFGRDWVADAQRRDFTINALSASVAGEVFDYVGGLDDIAARVRKALQEDRRFDARRWRRDTQALRRDLVRRRQIPNLDHFLVDVVGDLGTARRQRQSALERIER